MSDEEDLEIRLSDDDDDAPGEPQRTQDERERAREKEAQDARADAQVQKDAGAEAPAAGCADAAGDDPMDSDALEIDLSASDHEDACHNEAQQPCVSGEPAPGQALGKPGHAESSCLLRKGGLIPRKGDVRVLRLPPTHELDDIEVPYAEQPAAAKPSPPAEARTGEKRALKRSEMDEVSTHFKKGKKGAEGAAGVETRNLAKVQMQEMTPEEIQASISFPPPPRGLGPKRLLIHMQHPRVLEPPHQADLSLYLHAQFDALLGGGTKFLFTDRCSGFVAFLANLSCLFTGREAGGVSVAKLGRYLTSDRDLNAKILELIMRLFFATEVDAHVTADRAGGWGVGVGGVGVPGETDATREAMAGILWHSLQLLHNYVEFETQFAGEKQYQMMTASACKCPPFLHVYTHVHIHTHTADPRIHETPDYDSGFRISLFRISIQSTM